MATLKLNFNLKFISRFLSDESLTKKASLNALASTLDYAAALAVGFLVTPLMVAGLGDYYYGLWQILNRLVTYITPASGRPTQALRWTLANQQASNDYHLKRTYVGSALLVWLLFLPVTMVIGGVLSWFAPYWLNTPPQYFWLVRMVVLLLVANLALTQLGTLPQSVLQGENLGYKRMGMSVVLEFVAGGLTWLALYLNTGIIGVAVAALISTVVSGLFYLLIVRSYAPWFGVARPSSEVARQFTGLSGWFLAWNLVMNVSMASDVVILGMLNSVESVTNYTLTKFMPETLISIVAIVAFGIAPGLGGIIGSGKLDKAAHLRGEIMSLTWLVVTIMGSTILLWNRTFLKLWVGAGHYAGPIPDLLIVIVVMQFILIRNDANVIDLTLKLRNKVVIGAFSLVLALGLSGLFVGYFNLGIVGLSLGLLIGRSLLSFGYPMIIGRFLGVPLSSQLKGSLRPALISLLLFLLAVSLDTLVYINRQFLVKGWIGLIIASGVTFCVVLLFAFFAGLSGVQRRNIFRRIQIIMTPGSK
jgi:O-antigen/teichoic acid export membrane protein